jgi:hypothetical protein
MDETARPIVTYLWFFALTVATGFWTYWCSRGSDGKVNAAFVGFAVLGLIYCILTWYSGPFRPVAALVHLIILEVAVVLALLVNPQLEEMAGMLNFIIPALAAAVVICGSAIQWVHSLLISR